MTSFLVVSFPPAFCEAAAERDKGWRRRSIPAAIDRIRIFQGRHLPGSS